MKSHRTTITALATALSLGLMAASPAAASDLRTSQERSDQGDARKQMKAGNQLPLREIVKRHVPKMEREGSEYLGSAYDKEARAYRLKFVKDGRVTYMDVDARTGRVIRQTR